MIRSCEMLLLECSAADSESIRFMEKEVEPVGSPKVALLAFCTASDARLGDEVCPITAKTRARTTSTASRTKGIRFRRGTGTDATAGPRGGRGIPHRVSASPQAPFQGAPSGRGGP